MQQLPTSKAVSPRPGSCSPPFPYPSSPELPSRRQPNITDKHILTLLAEHEVLTTTQLVRLLALPERTVQHRLGCLYRGGFGNRLRPEATIGTSPYHCWLTGFGVAATGAEHPVAWSEDPAGVRATALLNELWLSVGGKGEQGGLQLHGWQRFRAGIEYHDARSGTVRVLPAEAKLTVVLAGRGQAATALVVARFDRLPTVRLVGLLGRFASYLTSLEHPQPLPALVLLARTARGAASVLAASEELPDAAAVRRLGAGAVEAALQRITVGVAEPRPAALATDALWRTPSCRRRRRLAEVLCEARAVRG